MTGNRLAGWAIAAGVSTAAVVIAVTELAALLIAPASSAVLAVGSWVIDLSPAWLKDVTIALFGTADKAVLLIMVGLLVAVLASAAGILELRRAPWGSVLLSLVGIVALVAVMTRAEANPSWALPTVLGVIAGILILRRLLTLLDKAEPARQPSVAPTPSAAVARRSFLGMLAATTAGAIVVGVSARAINAATSVAATVREALRLPVAASRVGAIPAGAELDIAGITPLVTANRDFYRIDTALQVPRIDASQWRLRVTGMVEQEVEITWDELVALPQKEAYVTLMCVSNDVGGDLTGNALWLGHPIRDILALARPLPEADMVLSRSQDGWTASTPLEVLQDPARDSLLAIGMNGELLPLEHGFPARMVVPGLYGYVSATKWVVELVVTRFDRDVAYWTPRGWSDRGPVKTHSRIDVPRNGNRLAAGRTAIAGIAWAQHTGIERVEVRIDGGSWQQARLAEAISIDTWRQWVFDWTAESGTHVIEVRATDSAGRTQTEPYVPVAPDGAEGYHGIVVQVGA